MYENTPIYIVLLFIKYNYPPVLNQECWILWTESIKLFKKMEVKYGDRRLLLLSLRLHKVIFLLSWFHLTLALSTYWFKTTTLTTLQIKLKTGLQLQTRNTIKRCCVEVKGTSDLILNHLQISGELARFFFAVS